MSLTINVHDKGCEKVRIANSASEIQKERYSKVKNQNHMSNVKKIRSKNKKNKNYSMQNIVC